MSLAFAKGLAPRPGAAAAAAPADGGKPSARIAWVLGLVVRAARVHVPSALARLARGVGARAGARVGGGCVRTRRAARAAGVAGRGGARAIHGGRAAAHRVALLALAHLPVAVAHACVVRLAEVMAARGRGPILRLLVHRGGLAGVAGLRGGLGGVGALLRGGLGGVSALLRGGLGGVGALLRGRLAAVIGVLVLRAGRGYGERQAEDRKCEELHRMPPFKGVRSTSEGGDELTLGQRTGARAAVMERGEEAPGRPREGRAGVDGHVAVGGGCVSARHRRRRSTRPAEREGWHFRSPGLFPLLLQCYLRNLPEVNSRAA